MSQTINRVVILGGGSAGWLTAGVLAAEHRVKSNPDIHITLVESPDVKTIGVGEGTWPSMRDTLQKIGVSETDFITQCDASFKQGSKFVGWVTGGADDHYYHPFSVPEGFAETNLATAWSQMENRPRFADLVSFQPHLCELGKAPKQVMTPEFAAVANYAYHLDAGKFGLFLQRHCVDQLGVSHELAHIADIESDESGDITGLRTSEGKLIEGDLFIDCTGFASLLLGRHYGVPLISTSDVLFCDTALAAQVPYPYDDSPIASHTLGTAQEAGWIWDIGLPTRRGVGHVYSSAHTSDEEAEYALWGYISRTGGPGDPKHQGTARKITFNPGYRKQFWHRNCVAVGISAGFVEPLEASALALIEMSARMIADEWPATRETMDIVARRFNKRFEYRWQRIVEFLKLHYLLSQRTDSKFWIDNRNPESVPQQLADLMNLWRDRAPSFRDFHEIEEVFPAASYHYILYGMNFESNASNHQRRLDDPKVAMRCFQASRQLAEKYLKGLPSNRELLDHVSRHGMKRI